MEGHEAVFKSSFEPFVIEIQNHQSINSKDWRKETMNVENAYVEKNQKTFLCPHLFRAQMDGFIKNLGKKDALSIARFMKVSKFSPSGAARTMSVDLKDIFNEYMQALPLTEIFKEVIER